MYIYVKRALDFMFAMLLLPVLMVIIGILKLIYFLFDGGPLFYNSYRLGKGNEIFKMYKFRTMKEGAPDLRNPDGSTYNAKDDERITSIGKILRATSIDEMPQILNVIKGDMSFIGPRPDLPDAIQIYKEDDSRRNDVRPGISGYSQAYFRNDQTLNDRFRTDVFYVDNLSFWFDVKIFFKTLLTVLQRKSIYRN